MQRQLLCGAVAVFGCFALAACAPYGYGRGYYGYGGPGYYGYDQYQYPSGGYGAYGDYAPPPAPYAAPQTLSQVSSDFVINVALSDSYEIEAGQLALQRSGLPSIRQFASQVVPGNMTVNQDLATALQRNGTPVTIPAALDARHQAMIDDLNAAQGPEFDRRYVMQQVTVHGEVLALLQNYMQTGDNPSLRQFALHTLPEVREGLRLAQALPVGPGPVFGQNAGPAVTVLQTCHKGLLWPFIREPGDCATDAERYSRYLGY